jgi:hypothetical protein
MPTHISSPTFHLRLQDTVSLSHYQTQFLTPDIIFPKPSRILATELLKTPRICIYSSLTACCKILDYILAKNSHPNQFQNFPIHVQFFCNLLNSHVTIISHHLNHISTFWLFLNNVTRQNVLLYVVTSIKSWNSWTPTTLALIIVPCPHAYCGIITNFTKSLLLTSYPNNLTAIPLTLWRQATHIWVVPHS